MVNSREFTNPLTHIIFALLLAILAVAMVALAHLRAVWIVLAAGFVVFDILAFFYGLSLIGQKLWWLSDRIANVLDGEGKERSDVECN